MMIRPRARLLALGAWLVACAPAGARPKKGGDTHVTNATPRDPAVEVSLVGERPGRPPQRRLTIDVTLRNRAAEPRWFLLPTDLPPTAPHGGVDVLEVQQLAGQGRAVLGRFLGTGGFQAALVPGGAEVRLHGLSLSYWAEPPASGIPVEVVIARDFTLGGEHAAAWFSVPPQSDAAADAGAEGAKTVATHRTPDGKEAPVQITEDSRVTALLHPAP
jgi:hypothetical protein